MNRTDTQNLFNRVINGFRSSFRYDCAVLIEH